MGKQFKKLIAPVIITVLLVVYLIVFLIAWAYTPILLIARIIGIIIPLALIGISVYVLIERIQEIRSGEEDDLSKY